MVMNKKIIIWWSTVREFIYNMKLLVHVFNCINFKQTNTSTLPTEWILGQCGLGVFLLPSGNGVGSSPRLPLPQDRAVPGTAQ